LPRWLSTPATACNTSGRIFGLLMFHGMVCDRSESLSDIFCDRLAIGWLWVVKRVRRLGLAKVIGRDEGHLPHVTKWLL
jgi:hypothetical protein